MNDKEIEVGVMKYLVRLNKVSGCLQYRLSDYKNKNNWKTPNDIDLIKNMTEYIHEIENHLSELEDENKTLSNIPQFMSIWNELKEKNQTDHNTKIFIYDSHMGGWYYTLEDLKYEDVYCEQCRDSDSLEWSGTIGEMHDMISDYL